MKRIISICIILTLGISCSVNKSKELEKDVKVFLNDFQSKLQGSDEEILKLFTGSQSKDEILKAIVILQNKDTTVKSHIQPDEFKFHIEGSYIVVEFPVELTASGQSTETSLLSFQLFKNDRQFRIGKLEGEKLYRQFSILKNKIEYAKELARRMADLKVYYDRARELQKNYDSVIWFVHHKNMTYYYAVKGVYNFDSLKKGTLQNCKMGLIDETGKVIVPVEFDLISNPSMTFAEAVEVTNNGRVGCYSLDGKEMIPPNYEWIVPYEKGFANALVKKDPIFGWLDKEYAFHENFPSEEAEKSIKEFEYLTNNAFRFGIGHQDLISILYPIEDSFRGNGLIIASSVFASNGILPIVNDGFVTLKDAEENRLFQYGDDYIENTNEKPFSVSETLSAFISNIKTRYIGGRGEFYTTHKIILIDKNQKLLSSIEAWGADFKFRKLSDELFESKAISETDAGPSIWAREANFPFYSYFKFDLGKLIRLKSNRLFQCTEFVKMDSSYLSGDFIFYQNNNDVHSKFASSETIRTMRDDILASYGFIFSEAYVG
ncbi:MAG TPA: hypothetical protein DGG95_08360, partial [Cytophagales bacterium]|nr:hypothetical protein [Cytophagales bacterium]